MRISIDNPSSLTDLETKNINTLAALGFGQDETAEMFRDTMEHVRGANYVQRFYHEEQLVGFALYKRCLWQSGD